MFVRASSGLRRHFTTAWKFSTRNSKTLKRSFSIAVARTAEGLAVLDGKRNFRNLGSHTKIQVRYQDYLAEQGNTKSKAYILQGGIKEWLQKFGDAEVLIDKDAIN